MRGRADSLLQDTHRLRCFPNVRFPTLCFRPKQATLAPLSFRYGVVHDTAQDCFLLAVA